MNQKLAKYILRYQSELKSKGIPHRKWHKIIFNYYWHNMRYDFKENDFIDTWKHLQAHGLVHVEKFIK